MIKNTVSVIIPFYGERTKEWEFMIRRAFFSIQKQTIKPTFQTLSDKDNNLKDARNRYGLLADTEFLIFLDADDMLDEHYIEEMLKCEGDVIVPAAWKYYSDGRIDKDQYWYTPKDLLRGNYIVIGAMIRTSLFKQLGGFEDLLMYEDWDFFLRAEEAGAKFTQCPNAIYKIHVREGSRNEPDETTKAVTFLKIFSDAKKRRGII